MKTTERDKLLYEISGAVKLIPEIRDEVKKTNGRVRDIEKWQAVHVSEHEVISEKLSHVKEHTSLMDKVKGAWWVVALIFGAVVWIVEHFLI